MGIIVGVGLGGVGLGGVGLGFCRVFYGFLPQVWEVLLDFGQPVHVAAPLVVGQGV